MAEDDFEADDVGEDIPVDPSLLDSDEKLPKDPLPLRDERRDVECGDEGESHPPLGTLADGLGKKGVAAQVGV